MTTLFATCRSLGHAWEIKGVQVDGSVRRLSLRCHRCDTTRVDSVRQGGGLAGRAYGYVPGYRTVKGEEALSREQFRDALVTMLLKGEINASKR